MYKKKISIYDFITVRCVYYSLSLARSLSNRSKMRTLFCLGEEKKCVCMCVHFGVDKGLHSFSKLSN